MKTNKKSPNSKTQNSKPKIIKETNSLHKELPSDLENNTSLSQNFPIVGIGASAGGLAAFEAFFSGMPANVDPNMAFVLVQHLAPDHKSILTELIQRYTRMKVFEVEDGMIVQQNCTYIIPPGHDMAFINMTLKLSEPSEPRGQRLPIDFFFRSLAQDQQERAICIVLSGSGSDGAQGVRAIKGEGGMIMAQCPDSTEYAGMPRSAIATGLVDYELLPSEMPAQLISYVAKTLGKATYTGIDSPHKNESKLKKIFSLIQSQTGHDFSQYKPNTLNRRIERRMAVNQKETIEEYITFIQQSQLEVEALFRELLIGVTNFFRDPAAFKFFEEKVVPKLFAGKPTDNIIRVWTPGCSTGEEAYSIAILLQEYNEALKQNFKFQIFATDIDNNAIATARAGRYPSSIAADMSTERLARFFELEPDNKTYRIHKTIRDLLIFSEHDIIKDPPFSKINLISCRNLLIYMGSDMQKKLIPLFHYALNPDGFLFLGTSETIGDFGNLFNALDRKHKLYQRKNDIHFIRRNELNRYLPPTPRLHAALDRTVEKPSFTAKISLRELTEQALLQQINQVAVLVDDHGDILYIHGQTGMYLEPTPGETRINNILKMARKGLQQELTIALHKTIATKETVHSPGLKVKTNGHYTYVNLAIHPIITESVSSNKSFVYLIVLEDAQDNPVKLQQGTLHPGKKSTTSDIDIRIITLKKELQEKDEFISKTNEELATSNEELKSSNEEMQSVNEELQSTNEELETSKEELQSINEELSTVNSELQVRISDLSRANNDMNNLMSGTGIATLFVDHNLRIMRFTPTATKIINLIMSDIGRPVGHIVSNLINYNELITDVQSVLDTLIPKEVEVQTSEKKWFTMRIQPYRTLDNVIEGAVISFIDITNIKQTQDALTISETRYRRLFETAKNGILIIGAETGKIMNINPFLMNILGYPKEYFVDKVIWDIELFKDIIPNQDQFSQLKENEFIKDFPLVTSDDRHIDVEFISNLYSVENQMLIQCDIRDVTERKHADDLILNLLSGKELLLKEVHHRIKNNMSIIINILSLHAAQLKDPAAIEALKDAKSRVHCMMELYNKMYNSQSFKTISVKKYFSSLIDEIVSNFPNSMAVKVDKIIDDFILDVKIIQPLGIIINELFTNIFKYAFVGRDNGLITVNVSLTNSVVCFSIHDNGTGMPESINFENSTGFGLMLINILTKQLNGTIRIERENGTKIILEFKL